MASFKTRIGKSSRNSKLILANDYEPSIKQAFRRTLNNIKTLHRYLCGIKLNFHLLLPLDVKHLCRICETAHQYGLQTIADIKLNDIGNTNNIATQILWNAGFDAVIVNPIMGLDSLKNLISSSHRLNKGVLTLCYMSAPAAKLTYDMQVYVNHKKTKLYQLFLDWAISEKADGIIVGATSPQIIQYCKAKSKQKLDIYSPGIGTQGGDIKQTISAGSDYLIVGRSILNSKDPVKTASQLAELVIQRPRSKF